MVALRPTGRHTCEFDRLIRLQLLATLLAQEAVVEILPYPFHKLHRDSHSAIRAEICDTIHQFSAWLVPPPCSSQQNLRYYALCRNGSCLISEFFWSTSLYRMEVANSLHAP
jgi:hypothetical protein